jgi:hypothetical protein
MKAKTLKNIKTGEYALPRDNHISRAYRNN